MNKYRIHLLVAAALLLLLAGALEAGPYLAATTTVASATVPVSVMPPGQKMSWLIKTRAGSVNALCFPYSSPLPTAVPTGAMELTAGLPLSDSLVGTNPWQDTSAMSQGWACVDETGITAITVDSVWRPN